MITDYEEIIKQNLFEKNEKLFISEYLDKIGVYLYIKYKYDEDSMDLQALSAEIPDIDDNKAEKKLKGLDKKYSVLKEEIRKTILDYIKDPYNPFIETFNELENRVAENCMKLKQDKKYAYLIRLEQEYDFYYPENRKNDLIFSCFSDSEAFMSVSSAEFIRDIDTLKIEEIEKKYWYTPDSYKLCLKGFNLYFEYYVELFKSIGIFIDETYSKLNIERYTTKEQVIIEHILYLGSFLKLERINTSTSKQAKLICALLNRNYKNVYDILLTVNSGDWKEKNIRSENIEKILNLFETLDCEELYDQAKRYFNL